jgi:transposase-like protein
MLATFINALMSAEADAVCGAPYGVSGPGRVNVRNGCRHRDFDTRAGTLDVAIPKLSCARAAISRTGCWNAGGGPRRR